MKLKICRQWVTCLLAILLLLLSAQAAFAYNSGTFGTCSWSISGGTLTIKPSSGSSCTLADIAYESDATPWDEREDITRIVIKQSVKAGKKAVGLFKELENLRDISGLSNLNVSAVTNMSYMFESCESLTDLTGLTNWNVSKVTNMREMFEGCESLTNLTGLKSWNVSKVTNMREMFDGCELLTNLTGLKSWNVSNVTDMGSMFNGCEFLTDLTALKSWNVSKVTNMKEMFAECELLSDMTPIQTWNVSNVTTMDLMFEDTQVICSGAIASKMRTAAIKEKCFVAQEVPELKGLKATVSKNTVELSWSKLSGRKSYYIYRSTSKSSGFSKIGTATGTSYTDSGLDWDTDYYYKVRAKLTAGGYSSYSSVVEADIPDAKISGLETDVSGNAVELSWKKLSGRKTYYIYRSTSKTSGFKKIESTTGTSYTDTGLSYGTTYYYKVRAKLTTGDYSKYSSVEKAVIPSQVTGLKASVSGTTAKLSWSKLSGAKTYYIYRSTSKTTGFEKIGTASSTSYSAKSLSKGKTYYFKVRAKLSSGGYSGYSSIVKAAVSNPNPQVTGLKATVSGTNIKLSWDKLSGAASYQVHITYLSSGETKKVSVSTTSQRFTGKDGESYAFKVRAKLNSGYSEYSSAVEVNVGTVVLSASSMKNVKNSSAEAITEECNEDGSTCTIREKVCTDTECTVTSKVCVVVGDQKACAEPVVTVEPVLTETPAVKTTPTAAVTVTETLAVETPVAVEAAAETSEECNEDGSMCTIYEKVCTETECTITSKVCVVVGEQKACAEPMITVVPALTETPAVTEEAPAESVTTEEAPAETAATEEAPAEPAATEEAPAETAATEEAPAEPAAMEEAPAETAATEEAPVETAATEEAPAETAATEEAPAETAATEEVPAEIAATEEAPAETAATEETPAEPAATEEAPAELVVTEEIPAESVVTEEAPAEPVATEEIPAEPVATEEIPAEPVATEEFPAEPVATEEAPAEPVETEEAPAEPAAMEEIPAESFAQAEPAATEDLSIREINIEDLTENTISFSALESYTIQPEKLKLVPEGADWASLTFILDDETVAVFKTRDIEVIKAEGLTLNGLAQGSTTLRIRAGEVEKTVTLTITPSAADIQAALDAEAAAQSSPASAEE